MKTIQRPSSASDEGQTGVSWLSADARGDEEQKDPLVFSELTGNKPAHSDGAEDVSTMKKMREGSGRLHNLPSSSALSAPPPAGHNLKPQLDDSL